MELKNMASYSSCRQLWMKGAIAAAFVALGTALSSCSVGELDSGSGSSPAAVSASPTAIASAIPSATSEFQFPQSSCGDQSTTPSETWYPVYIDNGDIAQIRSRYCKDAVSVLRNQTGTPSVQVASFTSFGKAQRFAQAVGGVVEPVGISRASLDAQTGSGPAEEPSSSTLGSRSAVLVSSEPSSSINIRERASTESGIAHVGYGGDRLQITGKVAGDDGYTWYSVRLDSGATGWVRGDFIQQNAADSASTTGVSSAESSTAESSTSPSSTLDSTDRRDASALDDTIDNPAGSGTPNNDTMSSGTSSSGSVNRSALLTASEPDSPINVRTSASTTSDVQTTGYAGDRIQIAERMEGEDGYTWYKVRLESGNTGWVRSDFVSSQ
jgi:uncharacterized protein YgiM (DUF1202 family)